MYKPTDYCLSAQAEYVIPEAIPVWPEGVPGREQASRAPEHWEARSGSYQFHFVTNVSEPALYAFPAPRDHRTGQAVLICPGGGYAGVSIDSEGFDVARFFNAIGISAFVLKYRDPAPDGKKGTFPEGPLSDAMRSMRYLRHHAEEFGFEPEKLGIMGFSSGGHLALTVSTLFDTLPDKDAVLNAISARPAFTIGIYPVVSFIEDYMHRGSPLRLLGGECSVESLIRFSPERQVTACTPPAFLVHAADDNGVPCFNSLGYFSALTQAGISGELHVFAEGRHGFGMQMEGKPAEEWITLLARWLERLP